MSYDDDDSVNLFPRADLKIDTDGIYTNYDDQDTAPVLRRKLTALCCSEKCTAKAGKKYVKNFAKYVVKDVPYSTIFCPDCEYALYWSYLDAKGIRSPSKDYGFRNGSRNN